jgi:hypothetical protein
VRFCSQEVVLFFFGDPRGLNRCRNVGDGVAGVGSPYSIHSSILFPILRRLRCFPPPVVLVDISPQVDKADFVGRSSCVVCLRSQLQHWAAPMLGEQSAGWDSKCYFFFLSRHLTFLLTALAYFPLFYCIIKY